MKLIRTLAIILGLASPAGLLFAAPEGWTEDLEAAKAAATKEKKDILIFFTSSDADEACTKLSQEVFSSNAFKKVVPNEYVLVEIALPGQADNTAKQSAEKYVVQGLPTVVLADAKGRPYARTTWLEGLRSADEYLVHLGELQKVHSTRDKALGKAAEATGLERAKLVAEALTRIDPVLLDEFYKDEVDAIVANDKEDTLGFAKARARWAKEKADRLQAREERDKMRDRMKPFLEKAEAFRPALMELVGKGDFDGALAKIDAWIAAEKFEGEFKQQALFLKLQICGEKQDHQGALKVADELIAVDPETETAKKIKQNLRPKIEKAVEESRKAKE